MARRGTSTTTPRTGFSNIAGRDPGLLGGITRPLIMRVLMGDPDLMQAIPFARRNAVHLELARAGAETGWSLLARMRRRPLRDAGAVTRGTIKGRGVRGVLSHEFGTAHPCGKIISAHHTTRRCRHTEHIECPLPLQRLPRTEWRTPPRAILIPPQVHHSMPCSK